MKIFSKGIGHQQVIAYRLFQFTEHLSSRSIDSEVTRLLSSPPYYRIHSSSAKHAKHNFFLSLVIFSRLYNYKAKHCFKEPFDLSSLLFLFAVCGLVGKINISLTLTRLNIVHLVIIISQYQTLHFCWSNLIFPFERFTYLFNDFI